MKTADKFKALRGQMRMSQVELAKFLDMSPGSIYKYEKGQHVPRVDILEKMEAFVNQTTEIRSKGELRMNNSKFIISTENNKKQENHIDANYVVGLQKNEIERLKSENSELQANMQSLAIAKNSMFDDITNYDMKTTTHIRFKFSGVERMIELIEGVEVMAKKLGYTKDELDCIYLVGEYFNSEQHPLGKILHPDTKKKITSLLNKMPDIYDALKHMFGNHYIPIHCSYIHKNGSLIHTMNYCSINWIQKRIVTKTVFVAT